MTEAAPKFRSSSSELILTVLSGEDKGVVYKLIGETISLGRSQESDVVLNDAKASRNHAIIERRIKGIFIRDLESRTGILLNGSPVKEGPLKEGDVIRIGETSLKFGSPSKSISLAGPPPMPLSSSAFSMPSSQPENKIPFDKNSVNPFIFIIVGGLLLAFALLYQTKPYSQKKIVIKDDASLDDQIEGTDQFNEKQQQVILEKGKDTQQYAEAQAFYLRGFREYREGNYLRAIQDFEAALALYPSHPLARRYLERSQLKNKEYISSAMERGERDFQQQRYMNAFNEYRTVILLTNDPKNKNYQLAQKRVETIQLILTNNR